MINLKAKQNMDFKIKNILSIILRMLMISWRATPKLFLASLLIRLISSLMPVAQLYVTRELIDSISSIGNDNTAATIHSFEVLLIQTCVLIISRFLVIVDSLIATYINRSISFYLDEQIISKSLKLPLSYFETSKFLDQLQRASSGKRGITILDMAIKIVQSLITLSGYLIILIKIHWILALCMLFIVIPSSMIHLKVSKLRFQQMHRHTSTIRRVSYLIQLLTGREAAKEIRIFGLQKHLKAKWKESFWENTNEEFAMEKRSKWSIAVIDILGILICSLIISILVGLTSIRKITIGQFVATSQSLIETYGLLQLITTNISNIYENALYVNDIFILLDEEELQEHQINQSFPPNFTVIEAKDVIFTYPEKSDSAIKNISFKIKSGEKVAIVGQNGSGKTTLAKLLLGLYKPTSGEILIDDLSINKIHPDNLIGHISALFQDFVKYQLSARENIAFGNINFIHNDSFLESAVTKANADPLLKNLPRGFDTQLGPTFSGGYELSVGQWQRLAISRAFLANSEIIILDEPTSSLDPVTESVIFENLLDLSKEMTTIFISHRLGICRKVDRIIVMMDGSIIEEGNHTSLMNANGEYAKMFHKQSAWYD